MSLICPAPADDQTLSPAYMQDENVIDRDDDLGSELLILRGRKWLEGKIEAHPQSGLFGSLPRPGPKLGPRLLSSVLHRTAAGVETAALKVSPAPRPAGCRRLIIPQLLL